MKCAKPLYIVSGTTGSIGREIAKTLAGEGKAVVLACRNVMRANSQCEELKKSTGNNEIYCCELDLDSLAGVRRFCEEIKAINRKIAALVNNAGVMSRQSNILELGYEQDYQVNVFSTALLTLELMPLMEAGASIIFTTSVTRDVWQLSGDFPNEKNFGQLSTYGRSKRAITMFSVWLAKELQARNIKVNCADPGVVNSGMITMQRWFDPLANVFFRPFISSPENGALSALSALNSESTGQIYYHTKAKSPSVSIVKNSDRIAKTILNVIGY